MAQDAPRVVRRFNRFYTRQIGVLHEHLHESAFSLTEARVLYELAQRPAMTTSELCRELGLDAGYLSRLVTRFEKAGWLARKRAADDGRIARLELTARGRKQFATLDAAALGEVEKLLAPLSAPERDRLVEAMTRIESLLGTRSRSYVLRDPRPGDMGWIIHRQAVLYAEEYGWNQNYEALVAEVLAAFVQNFDARAERCWIAEQDGNVVGSVFVVRKDAGTAKLRLLYVEPSTRGLGIGSRLVDECIRFARHTGYTRLTLWTNSVLVDARRIYERAGFRLIDEERHRRFGKPLVGQTWALEL